MQKERKKRTRRVKNLILLCAFTAVILTVSTYAWFIGMQTVNVSSFDVEIAAAKSLLLSLDGEKWASTVYISKDTLDTVSYTNHTNSWGGEGLIPMSTIGEMDIEASRMKIFEKSSFTATPGGYRLMASRVKNYIEEGQTAASDEKDGYVVFDLFVRNYTGTQYLETLNTADEEAIYLTKNSAVTVASTGVADTGIENSVRVAFTQIGRVSGDTVTATGGAKTIQDITCNYDDATKKPKTAAVDGVTGICRNARIWEPNDKAHVDDAIHWYETSCKARTDATTYDGACGTVANGTAYSTYAVKAEIDSADKVDTYDGANYNGYSGSSAKLEDFSYFTDTMKMESGTSRTSFMTLAPNSVTKLRVYVYIEGQDIDNYDFAQVGKRISVNFGFTKERFDESDVGTSGYDGPALPTTVGNCSFAGAAPTTQDTCTEAHGLWNGTTCTGDTKQYCEALNGVFSKPGESLPSEVGSCTEGTGTVPTTEGACLAARGTWSENACTGTTRFYCEAIGATFETATPGGE